MVRLRAFHNCLPPVCVEAQNLVIQTQPLRGWGTTLIATLIRVGTEHSVDVMVAVMVEEGLGLFGWAAQSGETGKDKI